jgi:hypothetical protein
MQRCRGVILSTLKKAECCPRTPSDLHQVGRALPAEYSATLSVRWTILEFFINFFIESSAVLSMSIS